MTTHPDFEELLRLLEEHEVDYMIVGGYAVAYHGYPRFTKDIDIFFNATEENAKRLQRALLAFGFKDGEVPLQAFTSIGNIITFGVVPSRVDLLNQIDAVTYGEAQQKMVRGKYGNIEVNFIGFEDLIRNKKATPRIRDKGDVEELTQQ
jgi:hypothetical protein